MILPNGKRTNHDIIKAMRDSIGYDDMEKLKDKPEIEWITMEGVTDEDDEEYIEEIPEEEWVSPQTSFEIPKLGNRPTNDDEMRLFKLADWWLNDFLFPEYANSMFYSKYETLGELVAAAAYMAERFIYASKGNRDTMTIKQWGKKKVYEEAKYDTHDKFISPENEFLRDGIDCGFRPVVYLGDTDDIPPFLWKAFKKYCKKKKAKSAKKIKKCRKKFIKKINKEYIKTYRGKGKRKVRDLSTFNPVAYSLSIDDESIRKNLKKLLIHNKRQICDMKEDLEELLEDAPYFDRDKVNKLVERTRKVFKKQADEYRKFLKENGIQDKARQDEFLRSLEDAMERNANIKTPQDYVLQQVSLADYK